MKIVTLFLTIAVMVSLAHTADLNSDIWKTKLESVIQQFDTTGMVKVENGTYVYRYHTLVYKFHPIETKLGDTTGKTHNQEGPKDDGILLKVSVQDGIYQGQLEIPQELRMPFWKTYVNAYPIDTTKYLWVSLSYGKTSDLKFVEALKTCFSTSNPRFGLYLVTKDNKDLDKIELAKSPLITEDDILDYNWTNHTMYITETAAKRIPNVDSLGKPFIIVVDGNRAYGGTFWTPLSSMAPPCVTIDTFASKLKNTIKIDYRNCKSELDPLNIELDPRNNESIKKVFRELGKLTEK